MTANNQPHNRPAGDETSSDRDELLVVRRRRKPGNPPGVSRDVPTPPPPSSPVAQPTTPKPAPRPAMPPPPPPTPRHLQADQPEPRIWNLAKFPSACRPELAAPSRIDPYWSARFPHHSSEEWLSRTIAEAQKHAGVLDPPEKLLAPPAESRYSILRADRDHSPYGLRSYVAALGVVEGWRTCTSQQLAAMVGDPRFARPLNHPLTHMFSAGLVDISVPHPWASGAAKDLTLVRPGDREHFELLQPDLTWPEWIGVTGGQPVGRGGHHDRHNILATELGLRLAEYGGVAAVLGEPFSKFDLLFSNGAGRRIDPSLGGADLTVVRPDGLRVAVELTSSTSPYFDAKVERVVKRLAEGSLRDTGVVVVFVVAPSLGASDGHHKKVLRDTQRAISKACRQHPGAMGDLTRDRIAVARWRDWFPSAHHASEGFFSMRASRIATFAESLGDEGWEDVDFLSPESFRFRPADPNAMQAVFLNAGLLGQTPYWLRQELLAKVEELDDLDPSDGGRGQAGPPGVPKRLIGLGSVAAVARHNSDVRRVRYANGDSKPVDERLSATGLRRMRSHALLDITDGRRTVWDVLLEAAAADRHHPYRDIELGQLLMAQPRFGLGAAERQLDRLAAFLGQDRPGKAETVAWLLDDRTARRRLLAWQEVGRPKATEVGFPWL